MDKKAKSTSPISKSTFKSTSPTSKSASKSTSTSSSPTSKHTTTEKKSPWKRLLGKFRSKSKDRKKSMTTPSKLSDAEKISNQNILGQVFASWSKQRNVTASNDELAALMLQKQIEEYETAVEKRRQRLLDKMRTSVFAVTGGKDPNILKATDDPLPYEPEKMNWQRIMEKLQKDTTKATTAANLQDEDQSTMSMIEESKATEPPVVDSNVIEQQPSVKKPSDEEGEAPIWPDIDRTTAPPPRTFYSGMESGPSTAHSPSGSTVPSSSSSSSVSERLPGEKSGHLTDILLSIVSDSQKPQREKENVNLVPAELAVMSRLEEDKFDRLINENTKEGLFSSQPKPVEQDAWNRREARSGHAKPLRNFTFELNKIETRIFCTTCIPRHSKYPFAKSPRRM